MSVTFVCIVSILVGVYFYMRYKGKRLNKSTNAENNFSDFNTYVDDSEPTFDATAKRNSQDLNMQPLNVGISRDIENNDKVEV